MGGRLHNRAGLRLLAATAFLAARRPRRPGANDAVLGTGLGVARLPARQGRARGAAIGGSLGDQAFLGLHAATAFGRARRPGTPLADLTVNRALVGVARFRLRQHGARGATIGLRRHNPAQLRAHTATAFLGTGAPCAPGRHGAINRAGARVARLLFAQGRAALAAKGRGHLDRPRRGLHAAAARARARRPAGPRTNDAIHRAVVSIARLRLRERRARGTTMRRAASHHARAALLTAAARHGARRPPAPRRDFAVDRARLRIARLRLRQGRAVGAAVRGRRHDSATAGGHATATRCRAR